MVESSTKWPVLRAAKGQALKRRTERVIPSMSAAPVNLISDAEFYFAGLLSGGHQAHAAVLAGDLIAKGLRFTEAIKVPFGQLAFAIQRCERVPQTRQAETMRIPILFRVPLPPGDFAANALILHGTVLAFRRVFSSPTPPATPTRGMTGTSATSHTIFLCNSYTRNRFAQWLPTGGRSHSSWATRRLPFLPTAGTLFAHGRNKWAPHCLKSRGESARVWLRSGGGETQLLKVAESRPPSGTDGSIPVCCHAEADEFGRIRPAQFRHLRGRKPITIEEYRSAIPP